MLGLINISIRKPPLSTEHSRSGTSFPTSPWIYSRLFLFYIFPAPRLSCAAVVQLVQVCFRGPFSGFALALSIYLPHLTPICKLP